MSPESRRRPTEVDELFRCLADSDRRHLLGVLHDRAPAALTERDLATYLVPEYHDNPLDQEVNERVEKALVELHHVHSPKLESAGLIDRDGKTVTVVDHPVFEDTAIVEVIDDDNERGRDF